jgi:hypothetical protein
MTHGVVSAFPMRLNLLFINREAVSESYHLKAEEISFMGSGCLWTRSQSVGATEVQTFQGRVSLCGGLQMLTHDGKSDAAQG